MKKFKYHILFAALLLSASYSNAQAYKDYVGAGHDGNITVTASHSMEGTMAENTVNGKGMDSKYFSAARFLQQATVGPRPSDTEYLLSLDNDFEAWIDEQFEEDPSYMQPTLEEIWNEIIDLHIANGVNPDDVFGPFSVHFNYTWWQTNMTNSDLLRQKVAYALSQHLVVSENSDLGGWAEGMAFYYDILIEHAFGNYKDLLTDVTLSFPMGYYLSHFNNPKAIPEENIFPDENYAREIMQLFTIGLYELNQDGTRVLDGNNQPIPTYDQDDIQEFAKVFTGLGPGELIDSTNWPYEPFFGLGWWATKKDRPMHMYEEYHDTGEKYLLNGTVLPAGQTGMQDIDMAIDNLFNHNNTPPFVANLLIKRLVTSNPSPDYISRVASAFIDNGDGVRGDMKAVIKAILLDEEARDGMYILDGEAGKVREPFLKYVNMGRAVGLHAPVGRYWHNGFDLLNDMGQHVLSAPSVFNFYLPDFQPVGPITDAGLTAPELKLHNTSKAITGMNRIFGATYWDGYGYDWEPEYIDDQGFQLDRDELWVYVDDPELLLNELDRRFTYGQLSEENREFIRQALTETYWTWNEDWQWYRINLAIYLMTFTPDFNIIK